MRGKRKIIGISVICLVVIVVGMLVFSGCMYYSIMTKHVYTRENTRGLADFTDYENLARQDADFQSTQGKRLKGYFYHIDGVNEYKGVIIVNNGFGSGHEAMMSEIYALAEAGYLVYGFDKTGYDQSEGEGIGSLSQGVYDLRSAISFVKQSAQAKNMKLSLYGKSWGAYCCLAVLKDTQDISSVISISAFNRTSDMMDSEIRRMVGKAGIVFKPFALLFDYINEDSLTAFEGLSQTKARVLILHSEDDETVLVDNSFNVFREACKSKSNVEFVLYQGKKHTVIKSSESLKYLEKMDDDLQKFSSEHGDEMTEQLWNEFLSAYDLKKCLEIDKDVFETINNFLEMS